MSKLYKITPSSFKQIKNIQKVFSNHDNIQIHSTLIPKIVPLLENQKGKVSFKFDKIKEINESNLYLLDGKTFVSTLGSCTGTALYILSYCRSWIRQLDVFFYGDIPINLIFPKLKFLTINCQHYGATETKAAVIQFIENHSGTLQILNSKDPYLLRHIKGNFPKVWKIVDKYYYVTPETTNIFPNLCHFNTKDVYLGNVQTKTGDFYRSNITSIDFHCLYNHYKFKAIIAFLICLKRMKISKDLYQLLKHYVFNLPRESWNNCIQFKIHNEGDIMLENTLEKKELIKKYNNKKRLREQTENNIKHFENEINQIMMDKEEEIRILSQYLDEEEGLLKKIKT